MAGLPSASACRVDNWPVTRWRLRLGPRHDVGAGRVQRLQRCSFHVTCSLKEHYLPATC